LIFSIEHLPLPPPEGDNAPLSFGEGQGVRLSPFGGGRGRSEIEQSFQKS